MSAEHKFDPKKAKRVVEAKANPWGLHIIHENQLEFTWKKVKLTIQGGVKQFPLDRMEVTIKAERFPSLAIADVYRDTLDLYSDHRVGKVIQVISERIKVDRVQVREALFKLIEGLEGYRAHLVSKSEEKPLVISRGQYKMSVELQGVINSKRSLSKVKELIDKTGLPGKKMLFELYLLSFSRYTSRPLNVVLIGEEMKCQRLLSDLAILLPKTEFIKTSALQEKELFGQRTGFFSNKLIIGQSLSNLSDRSLQFRFLVDGEVTRIGHQRQKEQRVQGPAQLLGISSLGAHSLLMLPDVLCLKLDHEAYDMEVMEKELEEHTGLCSHEERDAAIALLQEYQQITPPVSITNALIKKLPLVKCFAGAPGEMKRYLGLITAIAIGRRSWKLTLQVQKKDLIDALDLLESSWSPSSGLTYELEDTLRLAKSLDSEFKSSELRRLTTESPKCIERRIRSLIDLGFLENAGGDRYTGFLYRVAERETEGRSYNELREAINKLD